MYLSGDDNLTATERARMTAIAARLHWLGLAIQQANTSGMYAEVADYERERTALQQENTRIRNAAIARGGARTESAEAGPFGINNLLKDFPKYMMLGVASLAALFYFSRKRG
jgi:L,D-peptidoglycan transpeptidase YkuD (ErfK/YbiS/YcfS/YnhG family)